MTERRGRENKLKTERLRQRAKTAKVPESASPICLGAPPPSGSGILGTLRLRLKLRARGRAGENRGRERPRGPRGGRRLGGPDARVLQTAPYPAQDWALGAGPGPSTQLQLVPRHPDCGPHRPSVLCAVPAPDSRRRLRYPPPARPLIVPPWRRPPPPAPGPSLPLTSRGAAGPGVGSPARLERNARSLRRLTARTQGRELGGLRLQNPGRVGIQSPKSRCSKWKMLQPSTRVSDRGAGNTNS